MLDKSQLKSLSDFLVNLATAWFAVAVVAPTLAGSSTPLPVVLEGLFFGVVSLLSALYLLKE